MLKDHFQRSTSTLNNLRSEHFKVSEYLNKGRYRLKQKFFGKGKKHYDFDINSQQFFHEYIDDIIFQPTEVQEIFYNEIYKSLQNQIAFNNKTKAKNEGIGVRKNPSEVRVLLARHFQNRAVDLQYKKYLTLLRVHNLNEEEALAVVKSRSNLIQKQIQQCMSRQTRLQLQDYFEASYTQGGKPVPVNENGQPIYKYLDEEDCWFSNINREDVQAYIRNITFKDQVLHDVYWPNWYRCQYLVFSHGLEILQMIQNQFSTKFEINKKNAVVNAKKLIALLQKGLQDLSPGNLQQKQNLSNFIYSIMGIASQKPLSIPIYSGIYPQLLQQYQKILQNFFKNLQIWKHKDLIDMIPKLNSFISIMFKYQNQEILEGEKQIKLGLQDQIDIHKELITMLEEQWVTRYIKIKYQRFEYKMSLKAVDWQLDNLSKSLEQEIRPSNDNCYASDANLQQLIRTVRMTSYSGFRKIMKKRSEKVISRLKNKYEDMQLVQKYSKKSDEQINMQKLSELFKAKQSQMQQLFKNSMLKQGTKKFFDIIISDYLIKNPVEIEICESLNCIKVREMRTKILNILNSFRSYQRNIDMDLRVMNRCEFKFQLDDEFLINSNKQIIEKFQKNVKQNQTVMSKANSGVPHLQSQDFLMHGAHENSMLYKKDQIERHYFNEKIPHVFVLDGKRKKNILYDIALEDLKLVESRILQIGTHFINKYERIIKMKDLPQIVDRMNILVELFQLQEEYLYQKFNLIQSYYYLYENTTEPVNAHKIGKIIIELIYSRPKIDYNSDYFKESYVMSIEAIRQEAKILKLFTKMVQDEEKQKNKIFHKKFANMCEIPLTLWAYAYGDMQIKGAKNYNKLQRMNSVSSKMSKNSKQKNVINQLREQIKEEFGEDSQQEEEQFNIEQYDEYMLRRNMDDIFQDIVGGTDNPKDQKDKDAGLGVSSLGLENLTVNPKFEGGPHCLHNYLPDVKITSNQSQKLLNFSQKICMVSNIRALISKLVKQARDKYGFCSQEYQICLNKQICLMIYKILLEPHPKLQHFHQFQTDDIYHESVSIDCRVFQQMMNPILDMPSALQLSIPGIHEKHQNSLPNIQILLRFDLNILCNLIRYEKPINSTIYRQLNLSINFIQFIRMRQRVWHFQLQREQLINAYKILGSHCDVPIDKYTHCYGRSGQSQIFMATSELKIYNDSFIRRPCFNDSVEKFRLFCQLEETQLKLFRSVIQISKQQIQDYLRLAWDIQKQNKNKLINRNDILISQDKKNIKMISNRVKGHMNAIAGQILKSKCYVKYKLKLKNLFEDRVRFVSQQNLEELVLKYYLNNDTKKYNKNCQTILSEKLKKRLVMEYVKKYTSDLKHNLTNNETFIQLIKGVKLIKNYSESLPYLNKILVIPTQFQNLNKKAFYDQKKLKIVEQEHGNDFGNIFYIQSKEQVLEQWEAMTQNLSSNNLQNSINTQNFIKSTLPPTDKGLIFKWMFKIPENNIGDKQKQAIKHLMRVFQPFTGKIAMSQYRYSAAQQGTRNKFLTLYQRYCTIIQYIQSNLMVISMQVDDDIIDSMFSIIDHVYKFEQRYPLIDQASIYQTYPKDAQSSTKQAQYLKDSIMAPCFIYENRKDQLEQKLKIKITSKGYVDNKVHWAVLDQILDFIISKVQGYGVFRHSMLQLKDQMLLFQKVKPETALAYMKSKTENTYNILWLSLWELYSNNQDTRIAGYISEFLDTILPIKKLEHFKTPMNKNQRRGISNIIESYSQPQQQQKVRFNKGIYQLGNDFLVNKLKVVYNFLPFNPNEIMENFIFKSQKGDSNKQSDGIQQSNQLYSIRHNWNHFDDIKQFIRRPPKQFRFQLFARLREYFQQGKRFVLTKTQSPSNLQLLQLEYRKIPYFQYLMQTKINMAALTSFKLVKFFKSFPDSPDKFIKEYKYTHQVNKEIVQINTFNIYDQLQNYQNSGKIIFSKTENGLIAKGTKNVQYLQENNKIVRMVIFSKLSVQQYKNQILEVAIKLLKAQKTPKAQSKKIQNTSLIPRVHLISSFSSPLITDRKTYISQQYKLAFVQAFINRFRNKVSRVDLLSSGYGFVITVPDLEDCVNFMNKLLFTFTQKQFRARMDTFSQYYQILIDGIRSRNKTIAQQNSIIKYLQDKLQNTMEADYLSKVSKLLQQKIMIEQKLLLAEQASNGLQHRVRKTVQHEYDVKITALEKQNQQIKSKFQQFKDLLIKLTKDATKNNFLSLINNLRTQVSSTLDKKIDLTQSFKSIVQANFDAIEKKVVVKQQKLEYVNEEDKQKQFYSQEDIQKCKIGEDIIHDPYYVTKLINKMRVFNLFKMGAKRIKFEENEQKKVNQVTALHKIQDRVIAQTQREVVLRNQLIKAQQQLSKKSVELEKIKHSIQSLENQKAKLKILLVNKQKKIQQKQRQNQQFKKKIQDSKSQVAKIELKKSNQIGEKPSQSVSMIAQQQLPKLSSIRQQKRSKRKIQRQPFLTNVEQRSVAISLYQKFELSNKDSTWRQKCEQLYLENKKLLTELEKLKESTSGYVTPITRQGHSLNMRNRRTAQQSQGNTSRTEKRKFPNLSFKYGVLKQGMK